MTKKDEFGGNSDILVNKSISIVSPGKKKLKMTKYGFSSNFYSIIILWQNILAQGIALSKVV